MKIYYEIGNKDIKYNIIVDGNYNDNKFYFYDHLAKENVTYDLFNNELIREGRSYQKLTFKDNEFSESIYQNEIGQIIFKIKTTKLIKENKQLEINYDLYDDKYYLSSHKIILKWS